MLWQGLGFAEPQIWITYEGSSAIKFPDMKDLAEFNKIYYFNFKTDCIVCCVLNTEYSIPILISPSRLSTYMNINDGNLIL